MVAVSPRVQDEEIEEQRKQLWFVLYRHSTNNTLQTYMGRTYITNKQTFKWSFFSNRNFKNVISTFCFIIWSPTLLRNSSFDLRKLQSRRHRTNLKTILQLYNYQRTPPPPARSMCRIPTRLGLRPQSPFHLQHNQSSPPKSPGST